MAVGMENGAGYSIDGGNSWTSAATVPETGHDYAAVTHDGADTWVAVGGKDALQLRGTIVYSTDSGESWVEANSFDTGIKLMDVAYDALSGRFVAVGEGGNIAYSTDDGYTWTYSEYTGTAIWNFNGIAAEP